MGQNLAFILEKVSQPVLVCVGSAALISPGSSTSPNNQYGTLAELGISDFQANIPISRAFLTLLLAFSLHIFSTLRKMKRVSQRGAFWNVLMLMIEVGF